MKQVAQDWITIPSTRDQRCDIKMEDDCGIITMTATPFQSKSRTKNGMKRVRYKSHQEPGLFFTN